MVEEEKTSMICVGLVNEDGNFIMPSIVDKDQPVSNSLYEFYQVSVRQAEGFFMKQENNHKSIYDANDIDRVLLYH
jgi:hypothetical protein